MSKRWKLATKAEIETKDGLVQIKDREGLWYLQQDMLSKFLRRETTVELICPVQFGKMFTTSGLKLNQKNENNLDINETEEDYLDTNEKDDIIDENKKIVNFILTETDDTVEHPKMIEISDPYPGEPKWMRKRKSPVVIRYHKVKKDSQYERFT